MFQIIRPHQAIAKFNSRRAFYVLTILEGADEEPWAYRTAEFIVRPAMTKPTVFISYSHNDEIWKDRLRTHLTVLQNQGDLDLWDDQCIDAGDDWYEEIRQAITTASMAVLLVSADFLASKFIQSKEMPQLLKRRDQAQMHIFPIIVKPCAWKKVVWLARIQARPKDGRALSEFADDEYQIDTHLTKIAEEIAEKIKRPDVAAIEPPPTSAISPTPASVPHPAPISVQPMLPPEPGAEQPRPILSPRRQVVRAFIILLAMEVPLLLALWVANQYVSLPAITIIIPLLVAILVALLYYLVVSSA